MENKVDNKFKIYLFIEKFLNSLFHLFLMLLIFNFSFLALIFTLILFFIDYVVKDVSYDLYVSNREILDKKRSKRKYSLRLKKRGVEMENEK